MKNFGDDNLPQKFNKKTESPEIIFVKSGIVAEKKYYFNQQ